MTRSRNDLSSFAEARVEDGADGLTMADVLGLPEPQAQLMTWLLRQGEVPLTAIGTFTGQSEAVTSLLLKDLLGRGYVQETIAEGELRYQARLATRRGRAVPENLLQALVPGNPLVVILNPSGDQAIKPGSTLDLHVTITNNGHQSALIDIYIDEMSQAVHQWCKSPRERIALGPQQSNEVIFQIQVPSQILPDTYPYMLVVDAPIHYPESTPLKFSQRLQVLPGIQDAVRAGDPAFLLQPQTSPEKPVILNPGQLQQVIVLVHNRSDRVDRFRLTCPDLAPSWFSIKYPPGLDEPGLILETDRLDLNPGERGQIVLLITPPLDTLARNYVPTLRLYSVNNPDLVLLDLVYLRVLPVYNLTLELRTLVGKVRLMAGLYEIKITNPGNTDRHILVRSVNLDEDEVCRYTLEFNEKTLRTLDRSIPAAPENSSALARRELGQMGLPLLVSDKSATEEAESLDAELPVFIPPKGFVLLNLQVKPIKWWKRPLYAAPRLINFSLELEDAQQLPLPAYIPQGTLLWEPRPWWQFLLVLLTGIATLLTIAFLIWWIFFRPRPPAQILEFYSQDNLYQEANGDAIRLSWQINNPRQIRTLRLVGQSPDGKVSSGLITYDFSNGLPSELKSFCAMAEVLTCRDVQTDARKSGDYVFELSVLPRRKQNPIVLAKSEVIKIEALPLPKILELASTKPTYEEPAPPNPSPDSKAAPAATPPASPPAPIVLLNWKLSNPDQLKEVRLIGRAPDGSVSSPLQRYDFSQGIPKELKDVCVVREELTCANVKTNATKAGDYVFEVAVIPRQGDASDTKKTDTIKVTARPVVAKITFFKINGEDAPLKYLIDLSQETLQKLTLSWKVEGSKDLKVELLPAPGNVQPTGSLVYSLSPQSKSEVLILQVTTKTGEQVVRSVTIETFDSTKPTPGAAEATPAAPAGTPAAASPPPAVNPAAPAPLDPGSLSPAELPPQAN